ncbi:hypothetical protein LCGC14_1975010, partial [marine sediment metagenome]
MSETTHTLDSIPPGTVFSTNDGILAVKSEYRYGARQGDQWQCILLASGEYAHFFNGNKEQVEIVEVADLVASNASRSDTIERQVQEITKLTEYSEVLRALVEEAIEGDGEYTLDWFTRAK